MAEPTRGICGACGREVRVRVGDGRLWRHGYLTDTGPQTCSGSSGIPEIVLAPLATSEGEG